MLASACNHHCSRTPQTSSLTGRRPAGARSRVQQRAFPNLDAAVTQTARHIEEEVVIEGLLHVTAVQAGSCMERYGDDLSSLRGAPPLQSLRSALTDSQSSRVVSEAICLATPPDAPDEPQPRRPVVVDQQATNSRRAALQSEGVDTLVRSEATACQRAALLELYSAEALQAAVAVRRQRRKVLLRVLRAGRDTTQALLAAPAAVLGSLTSRDEDESS